MESTSTYTPTEREKSIVAALNAVLVNYQEGKPQLVKLTDGSLVTLTEATNLALQLGLVKPQTVVRG